MRRTTPGILALALALAAPASALDLTGTWVGKFTCTEFFGQKDKFTVKNDIVEITQVGDDVTTTGLTTPFTGLAIADVAKPDRGELSLANCSTDNDMSTALDEIARLRARTNPAKGTGSLKGISIYTGGGLHIGSCKWKYKRVDATDPQVPAGCP